MPGRALLQSRLNSVPVNVREEGFYILGTLCRFVVEQEGVLPHVHHEHRIETRHVARLVQRDPMIGESTISWILEADGPTNALHLTNAYKIRLPDIVAAEALFRC